MKNNSIYRVTYTENSGRLIVEGYFDDITFNTHLKYLNDNRDKEDTLYRKDYSFEEIVIRYNDNEKYTKKEVLILINQFFEDFCQNTGNEIERADWIEKHIL